VHDSSFAEMFSNIWKFLSDRFEENLIVVDVGSCDVGVGSYRSALPSNWTYIGVDIAAGNNVDVVMTDDFTIPLEDEYADVVISGQTIEHCRNPFKLVKEMSRVLKSGSYMFLTAPFMWAEHKLSDRHI